MSLQIVASALLVLSGLTWLGTGLLNFTESQFCDLYCSLTDLIPREVVNILFIFLGIIALGFAALLFYNEVFASKQVPSLTPEPAEIKKVEQIPVSVSESSTETFVDTENNNGSVTRKFKTSCCGR